MRPPTPCFAPRVTIAAAFQRFQAVIRASIASSPSTTGSAAVGDGVDVVGLQQLGQRETVALGALQRAAHQVRGTLAAWPPG